MAEYLLMELSPAELKTFLSFDMDLFESMSAHWISDHGNLSEFQLLIKRVLSKFIADGAAGNIPK